ncbi:FAD/NAD(P)-dependent oxidoreductase [Microvirga rosea]|uniref:FAD/NAD(P)-dependent oxidoreductase n=1 Tax=Microvirga rosea TaxID=2715425 RepID=UPI001D0A1E65|nr:NAD(P)/FAD-dependent oxidoreductase [Microvirga rosea]MCB8821064.1 FAD-dependent oxidoreductase [Microvirga rosea]
MKERVRPLIIGAGPAGIRAAEALVDAGIKPVVVDEAPLGGGQIYRQRIVPDERTARDLYGSEAGKATALHKTLAGLQDRIDYRPRTLAWNIRDNIADVMTDGRGGRIPFSHVILSTGATDRVLPIPGWTLPGVFTLGGAQIALKSQGCAIGEQIVFLGSGPLLYLVAWQYMKAGGHVAAVLDTAPLSAKFHLLRGLLLYPGIVVRGIRYVADLMARGVKVRFGIEPVRIEGDTQVKGLVWRDRGTDHHIACDAVGYGFALRSETQLADLAGCQFVFDKRDRAWQPVCDGAGRSSKPGIYLAGDGVRISGADSAELAGERAGLALIEDCGFPVDKVRIEVLERRLNRVQRFRGILEQAFPFPESLVRSLADDVLLCRCEEVSIGNVRSSAQKFDITDLNRLKALTRVGMGRCQGRVCGSGAAEILAHASGRSLEDVGRLRSQPPIKPLPLDLSSDGEAA